MKKILLSCSILFSLSEFAIAQQLSPLSVEKIMRDPQWIGVSPSNVFWSDNSKTIYFNWNPEKTKFDSLYSVEVGSTTIKKVPAPIRRELSHKGEFNKLHTKKVVERGGDIFILDITTGLSNQITNTSEREILPRFSGDGNSIIYMKGDNLFSWSMNDGHIAQLTNFVKGKKIAEAEKLTDQYRWLKQDQLSEFLVLEQRKDAKKAHEIARKADQPKRLREIYLEDRSVDELTISPNADFITYNLLTNANDRNTIVPNYVTESGYTEELQARSKVGSPLVSYQFFIYDVKKDTSIAVQVVQIPGLFDLPDYIKDYPKQKAEREKKHEPRKVVFHGPFWSEDGKNAIVEIGAQDNKDRWIMHLDAATRKLTLIDRQHDDAWIGGPGIDDWTGAGTMGWIDNQNFYYQSEVSSFSHLYSINIASRKKIQLTSGNWEVQDVQLSHDKQNFYITANRDHPGVKDFYRLAVAGGKMIKLTSMKGNNEVQLSPDEKWLAIRYSYTNKPWELFLQENKESAQPIQITHSLSDEFKSYNWRDAELINFKNRYGNVVYARLYRPAIQHGSKPAVIFVHGAGYLQNAHYWWSNYFREYMFHNLLTDEGYTVLDIDYQGSSGYGRNCRTNIYRHMGGKDLSDEVDGAKLLAEKYNVNPKKIGIYGGSYGGFMTLMAMFTQPDTFAAGAALRSVTDWAHYNHGYTSNILNEPVNDSIAYKRSSPIYFAEGLKGPLLMCHGMVDVNVHFQDIVRLSQRLIDLHKNNWELAVFPMEDHGFVEPSSWADEYKRIFNLFEQNLKK
ncbi:S9 family peptidase [Solitalea koreensis]|uniref:Dipeptidyl aminopeptidase/acylaminoacyl peptidase n=1 Tax=Solitalea koreensis TaxID=543615 RepID=A0A521EHI6_9SPHI|nr:prolyl oligopeptidase family serine peptidase [Solitalea koreensis]SMO82640.1 Dipeptidyl aminopeptidase/acylaminoacyl peptidase [Solitalea koreensis]